MIDTIDTTPPTCTGPCCTHAWDTGLAAVAALDLEPGYRGCCRCGTAYQNAPGLEYEEKTHGGPMEPGEARVLRLMLRKAARDLTMVELLTLAGLRLSDLGHPKNHQTIRRVAATCAEGMAILVRALLGAKQEAPSSVIEVPKLRIIDKNGEDVT